MSMKTSNDVIGDRTCEFPACGTVSQPTVPLCALLTFCIGLVNFVCMCYVVCLGMFLVI